MTAQDTGSPFLLTKQLAAMLLGTLRAIDVYSIEAEQQTLVTRLRRTVSEARLDTRDYELSETREEQLKNAAIAKKRLSGIRKDILAASEYNIFGSVDVAQLTATIEHIIERLA